MQPTSQAPGNDFLACTQAVCSNKLVWLVNMECLHDSTSSARNISESRRTAYALRQCSSYPFKLQNELPSCPLKSADM